MRYWHKLHPFLAQVASKHVMCSSLHPRVVSDSKYMKLTTLFAGFFSFSKVVVQLHYLAFKKIKLNFGGIFKQHVKSARRVSYGVIRILHPEVYFCFLWLASVLVGFLLYHNMEWTVVKKNKTKTIKQPYSLNWTESKYSENGY